MHCKQIRHGRAVLERSCGSYRCYGAEEGRRFGFRLVYDQWLVQRKKISESSKYELEVTNSYRFSRHLTYDICKLDWHDDILGTKDNRERVVFLKENFSYRILKKGYPENMAYDIPIGIISISRENLKEINRNKKRTKNVNIMSF